MYVLKFFIRKRGWRKIRNLLKNCRNLILSKVTIFVPNILLLTDFLEKANNFEGRSFTKNFFGEKL